MSWGTLHIFTRRQNPIFGVSFPNFPGCVTAGKTLDEARRLAAEPLALRIGGMTKAGEEIPEASTLDALAKDPALKLLRF